MLISVISIETSEIGRLNAACLGKSNKTVEVDPLEIHWISSYDCEYNGRNESEYEKSLWKNEKFIQIKKRRRRIK